MISDTEARELNPLKLLRMALSLDSNDNLDLSDLPSHFNNATTADVIVRVKPAGFVFFAHSSILSQASQELQDIIGKAHGEVIEIEPISPKHFALCLQMIYQPSITIPLSEFVDRKSVV